MGNYWAIYTSADQGKSWQHEMDFLGSRDEMFEELVCWQRPTVRAKALPLSKAQWVSHSRADLAEREHARRAA